MELPLPQWFAQGLNAALNKVSYLGNFCAHVQNTATVHDLAMCTFDLLNEVHQYVMIARLQSEAIKRSSQYRQMRDEIF